MNLLFWILEIANITLLGIPLWNRFFRKTRNLLQTRSLRSAKYGLYFFCAAFTIISIVMKFQCDDCFKTLMVVVIPIGSIMAEGLIGKIVKVSEFNL
jgi:hypothetical protein